MNGATRLLGALSIVAAFSLPDIAQSTNQNTIYPGTSWDTAAPDSIGWSLPKIQQARAYYETLPPANVIVVERGKIVLQWGDAAQKIKISSMRKSLLSALFGIREGSQRPDLDKTLAQLGIDDDPPLTAEEKSASLKMLLQARSGIYHSYVAGTPAMRAEQPSPGSHAPGSFWYYNNWDFNALGTIFEKQFHTTIGAEFEKNIAKPLGMQDFLLSDMYYLRASPDAAPEDRSRHPAYHFRLSARDLARFGYLYLNRGLWRSKQVVPDSWVRESTTSYSDIGDGEGYGYLWWVNSFGLPVSSFSAQGALRKCLVVVPERKTVTVFLNHTEFPDDAPTKSPTELKSLPTATHAQIARLLKMLLDAQHPISK